MSELKKQERITTKITRLANNIYGCRIFYDGELVLENRSVKTGISSAIKDGLRTLDKLGYDSNMAHSSRHRDNHMAIHKGKTLWSEKDSTENEEQLNTFKP